MDLPQNRSDLKTTNLIKIRDQVLDVILLMVFLICLKNKKQNQLLNSLLVRMNPKNKLIRKNQVQEVTILY